jgi:hypothetical protein
MYKRILFQRPTASFLSCIIALSGQVQALFGAGFSDRTIALSPLDTCLRPELLLADQVTDSTARLTWTDVGNRYEIELVAGAAPFTGVPNFVVDEDPPFELTGLTPGRNYRFQVRTVCSDTVFSAWSVPRSFTTALNNARPCPLNLALRDSSCGTPQVFLLYVNDAPGAALGADVVLRGVRLAIEHPWRADLSVWLQAPDGTRIQLIGGLNAGDQNIGAPPVDASGCWPFVELTDDPALGRPLSAAAERDDISGYFWPVQPLALFHNGQSPVGVWRVEICDSKAGNVGRLRLFELVFAPADCPVAPTPVVGSVGETGAEISWSADALADTLILEYGLEGFVPSSKGAAGIGGTVVVLPPLGPSSIVLSGLQPLRQYEVYLRRSCGDGRWSAPSARASFFTNCPATLLETFEGLSTCPEGCADPCPLPGVWQNIPGDDFEWKVFTGPGLTFPVAGPPAAAAGDRYLYFRNACSPTGALGKQAVLRSLCLAVSAAAGQNCHFSFDLYMNTTSGQMSTLELQGSIDGGQTWNTIAEWDGNRGKRWRREYVNLQPYHEKVASFQFVAKGTFGAFGDIAIDNLAFYGSQVANVPEYVFYLDADGDGFGNDEVRVVSCYPLAPPGYVTKGGDCNDAAAYIYPGAPEILCNQIDENCNGPADDDDIPPPLPLAGVSLCSGGSATLTAQGTPLGTFYWYSQPTGGSPIGTGGVLELLHLTQSQTVFLADSMTGPSGGCSSPRVPVTVTVHPQPALAPIEGPTICSGQAFDLAQLIVIDSAQAGGMLTYHTALPPTSANRLPSSVVQPDLTRVYYVNSTTAFGCTDVEPVTVSVLPSPEVSIVQGDSVGVCRAKNLQLQAVATGAGSSTFAYTWSNGFSLPVISVSAGNTPGNVQTFTVTVTDQNGCTATDAIRVHTLNNVTQTAITWVQNVSTCGGSDGSIALTPLNGTPPYTFMWAGGTLSSVTGTGVLANLPQGSYRITVTDATTAGCSMVMPQIVINAPGLDVELDTIVHLRCPGVSTGAIALRVSGQNPSILWSNLQTGTQITNLSPGVYSVTVTDGNCVQQLNNLEITAPPPVQIELNSLRHVSCVGKSDGSLSLAVFGATPPYRYDWSNGDTTRAISGLGPDVYWATITDANNCVFPSPLYTINEPPALFLQPDSLRNVRCFGESNGYLRVRAVGGVPPYRFQWNNGATEAVLDGLPAGIYAVTATDANGCTAEWIGVVSQPSALQVETFKIRPPTCQGAQDGSIELSLSGGQPPFTYLWSQGSGTSKIEQMGVGQYTATITDAKGCRLITPTYTLQAPQLLSLQLDSLRHVGCKGEQTGYVAVSVGGAVEPLTLTWNNQPGLPVLANVPAGQYQLVAIDGRSCRTSAVYFINEPELPLSVSINQVKDALCSGEPTGSIALRALGGTAPYQYSWSHGASGSTLSAVFAGVYSVTVTDANGCTQKREGIVVSEPPPLVVTPLIQHIPCFGPKTGSVRLQVGGGTPPYRYLWESGDTSANRFNLPAGDYSVTVFDRTGCVHVLRSLTVIRRAEEFAVTSAAIQPVSCNSANDGRIVVRVNNGTAPYQFAWSPPVGLHANVSQPSDTAFNLTGGTYRVTVTDAAGCFAVSEPLVVEEAPPLRISLQQIGHPVCKGDSTGFVVVQGGGGVPPYQFTWNNGSVGSSVANLPAGIYQVTLTDFRGCTRTSVPATVIEPEQELRIVLDDLKPDRCGLNQGSITVRAAGGRAPYTYWWNNGLTTASIQGLPPGLYQVTVSDQLGCVRTSEEYEVVRPAEPLEVASANVVDIACRGDSTGAIVPVIEGGTPPYQYAWSNGATTPQVSALPAGTYTLTVVDAAGCFRFWMFPITQPGTTLSLSWSADSNSTGWSITVAPLGGEPPYSIQWDAAAGGHIGPTAQGLSAGTYRVTVADANGCVRIAAISVGTVGVNARPKYLSSARIAPNPTSTYSRLQLALAAPIGGRIWVLSPVGQRLVEYSFESHAASQEWLLDATPLPSGLYVVMLLLENGERHALNWSVLKR